MIYLPWLLYTLMDWGIIVAALSLPHYSLFLLPLSILVVGNRQHALAVMGHDGGHFLAVPRRKRLNDLLSNILCFCPLYTTVAGYRSFHFDHHRYLGTPEDPERLIVNRELSLPISRKKIFSQFLWDLVGGAIPEVRRASKLIGGGSRDVVIIWWLVVISLLTLVGLQWVALVWVVASFTSFWSFSHLRSWTEHTGIEGTHKVVASWWFRILFLPHNTYYHHEHHAHPSVPFNKLPLIRDIGGERTVPELFRDFEEWKL